MVDIKTPRFYSYGLLWALFRPWTVVQGTMFFWVTCFPAVVRLCHNQPRSCAGTGVITNLNPWPFAAAGDTRLLSGHPPPIQPRFMLQFHLLACNLSQSPCAHQLPMHRADVIVILDNVKFAVHGCSDWSQIWQLPKQQWWKRFWEKLSSVGCGLWLFQRMAYCPEYAYASILKLHSQLLSIHLWSNTVCPLNVSCRRFFKNIFRVHVAFLFTMQQEKRNTSNEIAMPSTFLKCSILDWLLSQKYHALPITY